MGFNHARYTRNVRSKSIHTVVAEQLMQSFMGDQPCEGIAAHDRGFLYGDGVFTSIRVRAGLPCLWRHHVARLQHAQQCLGLQFDLVRLSQQAFAYAEQLQHGTLKIIISRGVGARGYLPPEQPASVYFQLFSSSTRPIEPQADGLFVVDRIGSGVLQTHRLGHPMPQLVGLKSLNRLEQVLLRQALAQTAWSEALVFDQDDRLVEGVQSNCWFWRHGQWQTPSLQRTGIAGVMRAEIISRMQQHQIAFAVVELTMHELTQIDALFFCNSITGILAVDCLDGRVLETKPVDSLLCDLLS